MNQIILLAKAWNFAAQKHAAQRRKGVAQEPYVNHLAEVAELVAVATDGTDANLVAAAVLHDTIEDTETTAGELAQGFNEDICRLVLEVTDDKSLAYQVRKDRQVSTAATKSDRAKVLKLADKTANLRSLAKSPPVDWDAAQRRQYLDWCNEVVAGLRGANRWLEAEFDHTAENTRLALGDRPDRTPASAPSG